MQYALIDTDLGTMGLGWTARGVNRFALPGTDRAAAEGLFAGVAAGTPDAALVARVRAYAQGERVEFADVPLDLAGVSPFNCAVYRETLTLAWGETATYGDIARRLGDVTLARAVGRALGENPIPLLIPCHRVMGANGRPTGFSAPGGVTAKLRMLALEKAAPGGQYGFGF